jgi:glycosyltransferase involved in cell wall biosynthesis
MKILLVTTNYFPEPTGIALYTTDLVLQLLNSGHRVEVLTGLPHYPWWRVLPEHLHHNAGEHHIDGVRVVRAGHLIPIGFNAVSRIKFELSLLGNLRRAARKYLDDDFDVIISCIPTVAAGYVARYLKKRIDVPLGIIVQDLSGKGAAQSGQRGGSAVGAIAERVENRVLRGADRVVVISESMRQALLQSGIADSVITEIPNYSVKLIEQRDRAQARNSFGWNQGQFIAVHTGNMGAKQDLGNLVEAAKLLVDYPNIQIKIIGHGNRESELKVMAAGLPNISILPAVSDAEYSTVLGAADLLLVNERSTQIDMSLPSKLTSHLFSNRAVLAAVPMGGATFKYLGTNAEVVAAGDPKALALAILNLSQDSKRCSDLAAKGLNFANANLGADVGRARYIRWVEGLAQIQA